MSRVKLLLDVISDIRSLAESLQAAADAMAGNEAVQEEKTKEYTLEDVRGILAGKSQNGLTAEVKELITRYGGSRLSDIDPAYYADIIKEAEVLGSE